MSGGKKPRTHLEKRLCRKRVCEREERQSIRVDFFPEVECDVIGVLVSAQGPDLLGFHEHVHATTQRRGSPHPHEPLAAKDHRIVSLRGRHNF